MNVFDVIIVQPIFNALLVLYGLTGDFGVSIILFTILFRLAIWPLIKKQLHQTKLMRKVQPELKKIKARTKGNKTLEAQLMMELYRERGIKPFSSIGVLLLQIPIFIGIYQVITILTRHPDQVQQHVYEITKTFPAVAEMLKDHSKFNENFLGFLDLTKVGIGTELYIPLILLAIITALLQYVQTKQLTPQNDSKKKLRDILKDSSQGKDVDQGEISAIMSSRMVLFMPVLLLVIALYLPGAVVLYYAASSLVAVIQQHLVLSKDEEELLELADKPLKTKGKNNTTIKRLKTAKTAKIVSSSKSKKSRKRR